MQVFISELPTRM